MISKTYKLLIGISLLMLLMVLPSCFNADDYDMDRISKEMDWTPKIIMPMSYGTYSLKYLLNEYKPEGDPSQRIFFDEADGLIHLKYIQKDVMEYSVSSILDDTEKLLPFAIDLKQEASIDIPVFTATHGDIPLPTLRETVPMIKSDEDIKLKAIEGNIEMDFYIENPLNAPADITFELEGAVYKASGKKVSRTFDVPGKFKGALKPEWAIKDIVLNFTPPYETNTIVVNITGKVRNSGSGTSNSDADSKLLINYWFKKIEFTAVKGNFGQRTFTIPEQEIDLDIDFWDYVTGEYRFEDPKLKFITTNSVGMPLTISVNGAGYNDKGDKRELKTTSAIAPRWPKTVEEIEKGVSPETIIFDKNNSNLDDVLALPPSKKITYSADIKFNKNADDSENTELNNVITDKSEIKFDLELDVPMHFSASKLSISESIDDIVINEKDVKKILSATLIVQTTNECPMSGKISALKFLDAAKKEVFKIDEKIVIDAAPIGEDEKVLLDKVKKKVEHKIEIAKENIPLLPKVTTILVEAELSTTNGKPVKLLPEYKIDFNLMVEAEVNPTKK